MIKEKTLEIASIPIQIESKEASLKKVMERFPDHPSRLFWANAHCVNQAVANPEYKKALQQAEFLFNDGAGIELAGLIKGTPIAENLNGTDLIPQILDHIAKKKKGATIYLLGGREKGISQAKLVMQKRWPSLNFIGAFHGFYQNEQEPLEEILSLKPDVLIVAMGVPKQELFITHHWECLAENGIKIAIAGGAVLDFLRAKVSRAPKILRAARLEWLYRLFLEPKRLWERYLIGNIKFLYLLMKEKR